MKRREFIAGLSGVAGIAVVTVEAVHAEKPLLIVMTVPARLEPNQRRQVAEYAQKHFAGTALEGIPVFVSDDLVSIDIIEDPR